MIKKIFRFLFVGPTIKKKIEDQQRLLKLSEKKDVSKLGTSEMAVIWLDECKIKYSIEMLNEML